MWYIQEHRDIAKSCRKLPGHIVKKYELWKNIVARHGPDKLKEFPGFHDEGLKGERKGERSSRLSLQYRVVYSVERDMVTFGQAAVGAVTVYVLEITPHEY